MSIDPAELERRAAALDEKVIDRIASDPQFAQQMKSDPQGAMRAAGLAQEADQIVEAASEVETSGYIGTGGVLTCTRRTASTTIGYILSWTVYKGKKK
jgi:hypothetical protein